MRSCHALSLLPFLLSCLLTSLHRDMKRLEIQFPIPAVEHLYRTKPTR